MQVLCQKTTKGAGISQTAIMTLTGDISWVMKCGGAWVINYNASLKLRSTIVKVIYFDLIFYC